MSDRYKVVQSNFFNTSGLMTYTGASNQYDLRWDTKNGNVELVQRGPVLDGKPIVLFNNDTWSQWAIENAENNIPLLPDYIPDQLGDADRRRMYSLRIANLILESRLSNGGGVVPPWIAEIGEVKTNEEKNLILTKLELGTLNKNIKTGQTNFYSSPITHADLKKTDVTLNTIKELMLDGPLKYPIDAIYSNRKTGYNQDHVRITQYTYKPPRPNLVGYRSASSPKKDQSPLQLATEGAIRYTPLESYLGMVRLPMPTDISDSNNVSWGSDQMNNISAALTSAIGGNLGATATMAMTGKIAEGAAEVLGGTTISGLGNLGVMLGALSNSGITLSGVQDLASSGSPGGMSVRAAIQSRLLAMAGQQVSPEAILARGLGVIPNSNMELLFNSPALREFSFSWKMTPRDEYEAKKVRHIIRFFKQGMAARKIKGTGGTAAGASSLYLGTPNVFHVQYKTNRDEDIEGVNRIKTCAVTGCAVNYTPDGVWSAYEEGQPVSTVMSLRMQELEPVYDTDYQGDIATGRQFRETPGSSGSKAGGDLYKISLDEVGY